MATQPQRPGIRALYTSRARQCSFSLTARLALRTADGAGGEAVAPPLSPSCSTGSWADGAPSSAGSWVEVDDDNGVVPMDEDEDPNKWMDVRKGLDPTLAAVAATTAATATVRVSRLAARPWS